MKIWNEDESRYLSIGKTSQTDVHGIFYHCLTVHSCFFVCFFFQLYSLNEYKPPISKAKMTQITKSGIKAIKVSM